MNKINVLLAFRMFIFKHVKDNFSFLLCVFLIVHDHSLLINHQFDVTSYCVWPQDTGSLITGCNIAKEWSLFTSKQWSISIPTMPSQTHCKWSFGKLFPQVSVLACLCKQILLSLTCWLTPTRTDKGFLFSAALHDRHTRVKAH